MSASSATSLLTPEQAVNGLFDLLQKAAAEADSLELVVARQAREIEELKRQPKQAAAPLLDLTALTKLAETLEGETLLPVGMTAKQAAENITKNPNILIRWMQTLAAPHAVQDGRAIKAANVAPTLSGDGKLVKLGSNTLVDKDGWSDAITLKVS